DSETEIFVFISGYGTINDNEPELVNVSDGGEGTRLPLRAAFRQLASIPSDKILVAVDIDFGQIQLPDGKDPQNLMEQATKTLTENKSAAVLMGNRVGQRAGLYDAAGYSSKMHHIFPYFLARAWQQQKTNLSGI